MSLCNIHLRPDRALIAVDSHALADDGALCVVSKLWPLTSHQAVIAGRGSVLVLQSTAALTGMTIGNLDTLLEAMPVLLRHAHQDAVPPSAAPGEREEVMRVRSWRQEINLVGWSPKRAGIIGMRYFVEAGATDWQAEELAEWCLAPGCPAAEAAYPEDIADMIELARAQQREAPETIGGILRVATVERDRIEIANVCDLGVQPARQSHGNRLFTAAGL